MKRKYIINLILVIALLISTRNLLAMNSSEHQDTFEKRLKVNITEIALDEKALLQSSEIIVKGILSETNKVQSIKRISDENGLEAEIPYEIYTLQVDEYIKNEEYKDESINIVFAFYKPEDILLGQEYVFFLESNILEENAFSLLSYTQAYFEIDSQQKLIINKNTNIQFNEVNL